MPIGTLAYILKLKDEQKTKIGDIQTKLAEEVKAATGDRPKMMELNTKAAADIDAILTDEQKTTVQARFPESAAKLRVRFLEELGGKREEWPEEP